MRHETSDRRHETLDFRSFSLSVFRTFLHCTFCFLLFNSCDKEKINFTYDNTPETVESSTVRIVNLAGYVHVVGNGDTLTNTEETGAPTPYFTRNGVLGETWNVPKALFEDGRASFVMIDDDENAVNFSIADPGSQAIDYYTIRPEGTGQPWAVPVPRDETKPSKPDHFKIRIVNLTKTMPPLATPGYTGPLEHLALPITLAYADGTPVSPLTTNITAAQRVSEYIEVPYGTYQFKVLTADGRQISATAHGVNAPGVRLLDPPTSRITVPQTAADITGLTYAPIETYQPGGVYTLVVSPFYFMYHIPPYDFTYAYAYQNQFKIVTDAPPPTNHSYAKIQCVNGQPGSRILFRINGERFPSVAEMGDATDYRVLPAPSTCWVEAVGTRGDVIAQLEYPLQPGQNFSFWLWQNDEGVSELLPVSNDLSTEFYVARFADNGEVNRFEYTMFMGTRYLNLCPDIPYASFTINNGQDMRNYGVLLAFGAGHWVVHPDGTMYNLQPGIQPVDIPYSRWRTDFSVLFEWMIYRSKPGITPGVWAEDIPTFTSTELVARPELYANVGRGIPTFEPGIYTLAVVGRTGTGVASESEARIIAVKHNR